MNKTIDSITITYSDGSTDKLPNSLMDKMVKYQGDHKSIIGFLAELIRELDIKYALHKQEAVHGKELQKLAIQHSEDLDKQSLMLDEIRVQQLNQQAQDLKRRYDLNLSNQRRSVSGRFVEKFLPYFPEYTYNQFDVINIGSPFDMLVLDGLDDNMQINSLVFQEVKTGYNARSIPASNSKERAVMEFILELNHPKIKYEHWAKRDGDSKFSIVDHTK